MIIGIGHRARSGKDTVAKYLYDRYGFAIVPFGGPLKEACRLLFGLTHNQTDGVLKEVVDPFWETTPRVIMQKFGTECVRQGFRWDAWIKILERRLSERIKDGGGRIVIPDVRFLAEAEAIKRWGGEVWRVDRVTDAVADHISENELTSWKGWDASVSNNGTLEQLYHLVDFTLTHRHPGLFV